MVGTQFVSVVRVIDVCTLIAETQRPLQYGRQQSAGADTYRVGHNRRHCFTPHVRNAWTNQRGLRHTTTPSSSEHNFCYLYIYQICNKKRRYLALKSAPDNPVFILRNQGDHWIRFLHLLNNCTNLHFWHFNVVLFWTCLLTSLSSTS